MREKEIVEIQEEIDRRNREGNKRKINRENNQKDIRKQAGAELAQAQNKMGLLGKIMLSSSIEVVFH